MFPYTSCRLTLQLDCGQWRSIPEQFDLDWNTPILLPYYHVLYVNLNICVHVYVYFYKTALHACQDGMRRGDKLIQPAESVVGVCFSSSSPAPRCISSSSVSLPSKTAENRSSERVLGLAACSWQNFRVKGRVYLKCTSGWSHVSWRKCSTLCH